MELLEQLVWVPTVAGVTWIILRQVDRLAGAANRIQAELAQMAHDVATITRKRDKPREPETYGAVLTGRTANGTRFTSEVRGYMRGRVMRVDLRPREPLTEVEVTNCGQALLEGVSSGPLMQDAPWQSLGSVDPRRAVGVTRTACGALDVNQNLTLHFEAARDHDGEHAC